ncbi:hypothetical protein OIU77_029326 [Salix suchowensis]|uniref:Large ribosomal subunit protein bL32c n=1 Tax=Salix suchowensis TaxID=1278906 RepID=A0ABQ9BKI3_9ROSI|nr:hypothetical protein OIU77_029326 [Salix suchowensis]
MAAHATLTASQPTLHSLLSPFPSNHSSFHGVSVSLPLQSFSFSLAAKNATKNKAAVAVLNGTSIGSTAMNVHATGLPTGDFHGDPTNGCTSTGGVEAEIVDGQILSIDFDTLIGSGFEVDELDDDLGRLSAVPKKRTSRTKKRIRKNVWKRKASSAALKALSLAKSIYTGKSKSFLSNKLKNE